MKILMVLGLLSFTLFGVIAYGPSVSSVPPVIKSTIQIPRQRGGPGIPAPFLAISKSYPGGQLYGNDKFGTVLTFSQDITGVLIKTEGYGLATTGTFWNDGNTQNDTALRANQCASVHDISINGSAQIHPYPFVTNGPDPDVYGPDYVPKADGLQMQSSNLDISRVKMYQIPGTALRTKGGNGGQGGPYGLMDSGISRVEDVTIMLAQYGWVNEMGDLKASKLYITQIIKDGIVNDGPGLVLSEIHVVGCDRGVVCNTETEGHACYIEASRIGLHLTENGHNCSFHGLNLGPGTSWSRCVKIDSNGNHIYGIHGIVRAESVDHPDIAGVEFATARGGNYLEGNLDLSVKVAGTETHIDTTSTGVILRGGENVCNLHGGWNGTAGSAARFISVPENITSCTIIVNGSGDGGVVVDLSATTLNSVNGQGNDITINWVGTATKIKYPGGGTTYNLTTGNKVTLNGVVQSP